MPASMKSASQEKRSKDGPSAVSGREAKKLQAIADCITNGNAKRIVAMVGAGISTAAGIPDFRSPDTGLYANLARLKLPYPEAVFDISFFKSNPAPFYKLAREIAPGKYVPTMSHYFLRLLHEKGLLSKVFTQNIDCLERKAGVPPELILEAHGSFASQSCIQCKSVFPDANMQKAIREECVPRCTKGSCDGTIKPDIVFFGEPLPPGFHQERVLAEKADLCIVMGTSLSVYPFAGLPSSCQRGVPRLLINRERVGDLGHRAKDVVLLTDCDVGIQKLIDMLGWKDEMTELIGGSQLSKPGQAENDVKTKATELKIDDEISDLSKELDSLLQVSNDHRTESYNELAKSTEIYTTDKGQ